MAPRVLTTTEISEPSLNRYYAFEDTRKQIEAVSRDEPLDITPAAGLLDADETRLGVEDAVYASGCLLVDGHIRRWRDIKQGAD